MLASHNPLLTCGSLTLQLHRVQATGGFQWKPLLLQVDVIVSEWMGYALLFESMLDTVLYARDRSALALACSNIKWMHHV